MSVESISRALNLTDQRLTPTDKLVLVGIANHDGDGGAWPSLATLARYAGIQVRGVQKCIGRLVECGYVNVRVQQGGTLDTRNDRRPNRYDLFLPVIHSPEARDVPQDTPSVSRGVPQDANGVSPRTPEPSLEPSTPPTPPNVIDDLLDKAARRIIEHRESQGYGTGGPGAFKAARSQIDAVKAEEWLQKGAAEHRIVVSLASRVLEPDLYSTPL